MKKLFVTLIALFSIGTFVAVADNDRIIAKERGCIKTERNYLVLLSIITRY